MKIGLNKKSLIYQAARNCYHNQRLNRINNSSYHTDAHIVVIESDDWGSIRTPSRETLEKLKESDSSIITDPFLKYDCIESQRDIDDLCGVLSNVIGGDGNPAVMTANFAMANADFDKIKSTNRYHREIFTDTYKRYYGDNTIVENIKKYKEKNVFVPQLHCLEHLNVNRWMRDLNSNRSDTLLALENNMYGVSSSFTQENPFGYMDAFNYVKEEERNALAENIMLASEWFERVFGKKSESFTASCYVWDEHLERTLVDLGIAHIQSGVQQLLPFYYSEELGTFRKVRHKMAEKKASGIYYTIRNCTFEPSITGNPEWAKKECFFQINNAFHNRVPAIISSHRLNYIGVIDEKNKMRNLAALEQLLRQILDKYPDTIFMSSDSLGRVIFSNHYGC